MATGFNTTGADAVLDRAQLVGVDVGRGGLHLPRDGKEHLRPRGRLPAIPRGRRREEHAEAAAHPAERHHHTSRRGREGHGDRRRHDDEQGAGAPGR